MPTMDHIYADGQFLTGAVRLSLMNRRPQRSTHPFWRAFYGSWRPTFYVADFLPQRPMLSSKNNQHQQRCSSLGWDRKTLSTNNCTRLFVYFPRKFVAV